MVPQLVWKHTFSKRTRAVGGPRRTLYLHLTRIRWPNSLKGIGCWEKTLYFVNFLKSLQNFLKKPEKLWLFVTEMHRTRYIGRPSCHTSTYGLSTNRSSYSPLYRQRALYLSTTTDTGCLPSLGKYSISVVEIFQISKTKKREKEGERRGKRRKGREEGGERN